MECEGGWLLTAPSGQLRKAAEREQEVVTHIQHTTIRISVLGAGNPLSLSDIEDIRDLHLQ